MTSKAFGRVITDGRSYYLCGKHLRQHTEAANENEIPYSLDFSDTRAHDCYRCELIHDVDILIKKMNPLGIFGFLFNVNWNKDLGLFGDFASGVCIGMLVSLCVFLLLSFTIGAFL